MAGSTRDDALAMLRAWRLARPWARRDPASLAIESVAVTGPIQVSLRSVFEARGVRYRLTPAITRTLENVPGPDPWACPLAQPADAPVGHEVTTTEEGAPVPMDCGFCSATGEMRCPRCGGDGRVPGGKQSMPCPRCGGSATVQCGECGGSGGLVGYPTIWSRIEEHVERRGLRTESLPLAVAFDLSVPVGGGIRMHHHKDARVAELRVEGGYRDASPIDDDVARTARLLCENPGVPEQARIREQELEVNRVPVYEVKLDDGRSIHVWGSPAQITPSGALDSLASRGVRLAPWIAVGVALTGVAIYVAMR